jgi:hypothetical protein
MSLFYSEWLCPIGKLCQSVLSLHLFCCMQLLALVFFICRIPGPAQPQELSAGSAIDLTDTSICKSQPVAYVCAKQHVFPTQRPRCARTLNQVWFPDGIVNNSEEKNLEHWKCYKRNFRGFYIFMVIDEWLPKDNYSKLEGEIIALRADLQDVSAPHC